MIHSRTAHAHAAAAAAGGSASAMTKALPPGGLLPALKSQGAEEGKQVVAKSHRVGIGERCTHASWPAIEGPTKADNRIARIAFK